MNNKEVLGNTEAQNENVSEWTNQDFPEFNSAEKQEQEQVDIDKLAQDLVKARKDMREGATWDKEQRAYIGEDGLPRDWAHLVGYLKRNPDAIKTATETLAQLRAEDAPAETSAEGPALETEEASVEIEEDTTETEEANAEIEEDSTEIEEDNSEIEEDAAEIEEDTAETEPKAAEVTPINPAEKVANSWKKRFSEGLNVTKETPKLIKRDQVKLIEESNERVQTAYALKKAEQERERALAEINKSEDKLDRLPLFTLPWSKNGKEKRALRRTIKNKEQAINDLSDQIESHAKYLEENKLTQEDKTTIKAIESLDDIAKEAANKEYNRTADLITYIMIFVDYHDKPEENRPDDYEEALQEVKSLGLDRYEGEELKKVSNAVIENLRNRMDAIEESFREAA